MTEQQSIPKRLYDAMRISQISQSELARRIGVSQGTIQHILRGTTRKSKYIPDIARELRVPVSWLQGEEDNQALVDGGEVIAQGAVALREVDIGFGMGGGTFLEEHADTEWRTFDGRWLADITSSRPDMLFVARGVGDSMWPTLHDSDVIIVDRGRQRLDQQDRIWALTYGGLGMVKRVRALSATRILIISDNPAVSDFEADPEELRVIGRVAWVGRKM